MTGIIGSEIVLLGLVALPQMLAAGYNRKLAMGTICAGGSLGTMIPPSIVLIIYGLTVNVSIGELFLASFMPGTAARRALLAYILIRCRIEPEPRARRRRRTSARLRLREKVASFEGLILPLRSYACVMISIYAGIASVSEAAGGRVRSARWSRRRPPRTHLAHVSGRGAADRSILAARSSGW